jgi:MFS family permease
LLWIGQSVSEIGNALYYVALPFQILALGGSPLQLGIGFTVFSTAQLLSLLFGGALVDRLPRRRVILASDLASGIVIGVIAVLGINGHLQIVHLYVASGFFGIAFSFYTPAMSAIMPELVANDVLVAGNSLRGLAGQSARVVGPLLGGVIVARFGAPTAFAIDAATFFFSFAVFSVANPPRREPPASRSLVAQVREGLSFVFSVPWIWITIIGFGFINSFYFAAFSVALPLLVLKVLMGNAATFGLIGAAAGIGEVIGGLIVGNLRFRRVGLAMYGGSVLGGLSMIGYGIVPALPVVLVAAAGFGLAVVAFNTLWESALQKHVPLDLIGRVTSVDYFGSFIAAPVAPVAAAAAIPLVGPGGIFIIAGAVSVIYSALTPALTPSIRRLD